MPGRHRAHTPRWKATSRRIMCLVVAFLFVGVWLFWPRVGQIDAVTVERIPTPSVTPSPTFTPAPTVSPIPLEIR